MKEDEFEGLQKTLRIFDRKEKSSQRWTITGVAMSSQCSEKPPECVDLVGLANEAEVQFAIVDSIVQMVCEKWDLEVYFM